MSADQENGGPAFPATEAHGLNSGVPGMTLRDYFAAAVLPAMYRDFGDDFRAGRPGGVVPEDWKMGMALDAYAMADTMLKAREA